MLAPTAEPQYFEVRDVARACGVADATVRHWEKPGVIAPPARTPAGRRIFTRRRDRGDPRGPRGSQPPQRTGGRGCRLNRAAPAAAGSG